MKDRATQSALGLFLSHSLPACGFDTHGSDGRNSGCVTSCRFSGGIEFVAIVDANGISRQLLRKMDYAEAAVAVLTSKGHDGKTYELAGDKAYTLSDLAAADRRRKRH